MKVALITRHAVSNYGSFFQTYATQEVLKKLDFEVEVINYIRSDENYKNISKVMLKKSNKWNRNPLSRFFYYIILQPNYFFMGKKFEQYRSDYLSLSNEIYSNREELKKVTADCFLTGSDQVWGPIGDDSLDPSYFLDFVRDDKKCFSYAASLGKTIFTEDVTMNMSKYLMKYDKITVREKSAVDIIKKLGFRNIDQVLDPTLLLTAQEWNKFIQKEVAGEYVLIYQLHRNQKMDYYATQFAKTKNLPLIRITPSLHHVVRGGKAVYLPSLGEWLSYIKNAKYFITDSFHGTAFAVNFETQFINISPGLTATRNVSLLELTNLQDRMLKSYDDFDIFDNHIDFSFSSKVLDEERKKSINWLKETLG